MANATDATYQAVEHITARGIVVRERSGTPLPGNILEPEQRFGKYRWPQVER